jgi:hypothetical protein
MISIMYENILYVPECLCMWIHTRAHTLLIPFCSFNLITVEIKIPLEEIVSLKNSNVCAHTVSRPSM